MAYVPCQLCGSTSPTEQDGEIYCANGHHLGPADAVDDDELAFSRGGKVVRRKIEKAEKRGKVFRGVKGGKLGLVAMGRVLGRVVGDVGGVIVGVGGKGKGKEGEGEGERLWEVVRASWELRVRAVVAGFREEGGEETKVDVKNDGEQEAEGGRKQMRKAGDKPSLMDIAALVYMGLVLLRYPIDLKTFFG
jgi:hypothetical protein